MDYRSSFSLFGLPLVQVSTGRIVDGAFRPGVATGWVAVGDIAIGIVVACGGVAVGGISIGGVSLGLFSIGGLALGLVALGGLSVGLLALGGAALAWHVAVGGLPVAHDYAAGGVALAQRTLSPLSPDFRAAYPPRQAPFGLEDAFWLLAIVLALLVFARRVQGAQGSNLKKETK
jgi:hypothetical protein